MNENQEMPRYKCHKTVWALKIKALTDTSSLQEESDSSLLLTPCEEGYAPFRIDREFVRKHKPEVGGYFVQYQDGYKSFSPAKAFETGYTRIYGIIYVASP